MHPRTSSTVAILLTLLFLTACSTSLFSSYNLKDVSEARAEDQVTIEDSATVFFATYPNPYTDREFLWFASFVEGPVELYVHNSATDSIMAIYRFAKQDIPVYTISLHPKEDELVKCVVYVNGRMKCAKVYAAWTPMPMPQWKTQYTIEER